MPRFIAFFRAINVGGRGGQGVKVREELVKADATDNL
jgi:uncharacterized protein (DUF1697 family)